LETLNQFENLKRDLEELEVMAVGIPPFAAASKTTGLVASSFESYILAVTRTKEELGFKN
jgi:hypothetical protein